MLCVCLIACFGWEEEQGSTISDLALSAHRALPLLVKRGGWWVLLLLALLGASGSCSTAQMILVGPPPPLLPSLPRDRGTESPVIEAACALAGGLAALYASAPETTDLSCPDPDLPQTIPDPPSPFPQVGIAGGRFSEWIRWIISEWNSWEAKSKLN